VIIKQIKVPAFTLAEVLITLGIIGIVSAMTIPTLISKINEIKYRTTLTKTYSTFSQALKLAEVQDDYFAGWNYEHTSSFTQEVCNKLAEHIKMGQICGTAPGCWRQTYGNNGQPALYTRPTGLFQENYTFITNNGVFVALDIWETVNITKYTGVQKGLLDGNAHLVIAVDVNGERLPNKLGKDVYMFVLTSNGLVPAGVDNNSENCEKYINYNWDCAAKVIKK